MRCSDRTLEHLRLWQILVVDDELPVPGLLNEILTGLEPGAPPLPIAVPDESWIERRQA